MSNINHVVGINGSEGCEAVTDHSKESNQNTVNDVNNVDLLSPNIDPADQEQDPCKSEEGNESGIECDKEAKSCKCFSKCMRVMKNGTYVV